MFKIRTLLLTACIFAGLTGIANADSDQVKAFNKAYQAYLEFDQQGAPEKSLPEAKKALALGEEILDANEAELPILTYNYGNNLVELKKWQKAKPVLEKALSRYQSHYGQQSSELIPVLMDLGEVEIRLNFDKHKSKYYKNALKLSAQYDGDTSVDYGWHLTDAGSTMLSYSDNGAAGKHLNHGYKILQKNLGDKHVRTGYAAFHLAKYEMSRNHFPKARDYLLLALISFENPDQPSNQLELSTHAFLVKIYEELGQTDNATAHCQAIGRMTPVEPGQELMILFNTAPNYPRSAVYSGKSGFAKLSFDVDEYGIVRNPQVIEVSGDEAFGSASIDALNKWRFAPRFVDGQPVTTSSTQVMTFELSPN